MSWRRWGGGQLEAPQEADGPEEDDEVGGGVHDGRDGHLRVVGEAVDFLVEGGPEVGDGGAHEGVQEGQGDAEGGAVGDGDAAEPDVGCAVGKQAEVGEADGYFGEGDADGVGRLVGVGGYRCRDVIAHVEVDHVQSEAVRSLVCEVGRVAQDEELDRK